MIIDGEYVKGSYYHDHSLRKLRKKTRRCHDEFRVDVVYNGQRFRSRHKTIADAKKQLLLLKQQHIDEYLKCCEWCGRLFEVENSIQRYCSPKCRALAAKRRKFFQGSRIINEDDL